MRSKWFWWKWPIPPGQFRLADFDIFRVLRVVFARKWSISYGPYDMDMIHMKLNISLNKYGRYIKFNENKDISSFQFPAANPLVKKTYSLSFQASFQRNWSSNNEYILKNGICSHFILLFRCPNYKFCPTRYIFRWKWPILDKFWTKIHFFKLEMYQKLIFGWKRRFFKNQSAQSQNFEIDFESFDPELLENFK